MLFWQFVKLLPGEQKTVFAFHYLLSKFRKLHIFKKLSISTKIALGGMVLFYLLGYQPAWNFPPFKQSVSKADDFSQEQQIEAVSLSQPVQLPHPGYLTSRFSSWHPGVDIATGIGMPIHPLLNGRVVEVNVGLWGLGHYVVLEHEQGYQSTYGHMGRIFVKKSDFVTTASIIGEVGMTGNTSGPHTHLEVTRFGKYIDPLSLLPSLPNWPTNVNNAPKGQRELLAAKVQATPTPIKFDPTPTPIRPLTLDMTKMGYPKLERNNTKTPLLPLQLPLDQP